MANNEKKPQSVAVKNMQDLAKSTASGMQSLAKKTAKGAQNIAKSTAENVKNAQAKKKAEAEKKASEPKKTAKKKGAGINLKFIGGALLRKWLSAVQSSLAQMPTRSISSTFSPFPTVTPAIT